MSSLVLVLCRPEGRRLFSALRADASEGVGIEEGFVDVRLAYPDDVLVVLGIVLDHALVSSLAPLFLCLLDQFLLCFHGVYLRIFVFGWAFRPSVVHSITLLAYIIKRE